MENRILRCSQVRGWGSRGRGEETEYDMVGGRGFSML